MFDLWKKAIGSLCVSVLMAGCQAQSPSEPAASSMQAGSNDDNGHQDTDAASEIDRTISTALAGLSLQDQPIAMAQRYCAVMNKSRLGSMGTPIKFEIKGEPVFVCCAGCKSKALKSPDATLAKVAELKAASSAAQ
jgi:hypothetical protein